jgi:hypothetical protein
MFVNKVIACCILLLIARKHSFPNNTKHLITEFAFTSYFTCNPKYFVVLLICNSSPIFFTDLLLLLYRTVAYFSSFSIFLFLSKSLLEVTCTYSTGFQHVNFKAYRKILSSVASSHTIYVFNIICLCFCLETCYCNFKARRPYCVFIC